MRTDHVDLPTLHTYDIDPTPLLELAIEACHRAGEPPTGERLAAMIGTTRRNITRWKAGHRTNRINADRYAVHLGRHPLELWAEF